MNIEYKDIDNLNIIDIRTKEEYEKGHIPNSINISFNDLLIKPNIYLKKEEKYYIYCRSGFSSYKLCEILRKNGYNVFNIKGGYDKYLINKK